MLGFLLFKDRVFPFSCFTFIFIITTSNNRVAAIKKSRKILQWVSDHFVASSTIPVLFMSMIYFLPLATHTKAMCLCFNSLFREFFLPFPKKENFLRVFFCPCSQFFAPRAQNQNWKIEENFPRKMYRRAAPEDDREFSCVYTRRRCCSVKRYSQTQRFEHDKFFLSWLRRSHFSPTPHHPPQRQDNINIFNLSLCVHSEWVSRSSRSILIEQCSSL